MTNPTLTESEYKVIAEHNERLMDGVRKTIADIRSIPRSKRPDYMNGMLDWNINVLQGLKWSTKIAAQRARIAPNGGLAVK